MVATEIVRALIIGELLFHAIVKSLMGICERRNRVCAVGEKPGVFIFGRFVSMPPRCAVASIDEF